MDMVDYEFFYDQLIPYLPGVELPLVNLQIRKVMRDFLTRTTLAREKFPFETIAGTDTYRLNATYGEVCSILSVKLPAYSPHPLPVVAEERRWPMAEGQPRGWFAALPHLPVLWPTPDAEYAVEIEAAVRPTLGDDLFPQDVVTQHMEAISMGVLGAMYSMPGKPWTKADAAAGAARGYSSAVKTIRATMRDGGQPNASTFRPIAIFGK